MNRRLLCPICGSIGYVSSLASNPPQHVFECSKKDFSLNYYERKDAEKEITQQELIKEANKSVFLYVHGDEGSVINFTNEFDIPSVYKDMVEENKTEIELKDNDGNEIIVEIVKFGRVDSNYENFLKERLCDYDQLKSKDLIRIK